MTMELISGGVLVLMILDRVFGFLRSRNGLDPHSIEIKNLSETFSEHRIDQKEMKKDIQDIKIELAGSRSRKRRR